MRQHIIISGTGRAGTTLLVQVLTELGLDTGFADPFTLVDKASRAGLEWDLRDPAAPYIVKNPWLCDSLEEIIEGGGIRIEHAIVPIRKLEAAAESRRRLHAEAGPDGQANVTFGGLWHTGDPARQEEVLCGQLYKLLHALARFDIPATFLYYPRFAREPSYLYSKLHPIWPDISPDRMLHAFEKVVRPDYLSET